MKIRGGLIAAKIIEKLKKQKRPDKILAAVLVGENPQSKSFLRQKELMAKELGIVFQLFQLPDSILEDVLIKEIKRISADEEIGGLIIQLPLPPHFNRDKALSAVDPKKDVDALTSESRQFVDPLPVAVVKDILSSIHFPLSSKSVAVVGRGFLVGKPVADYFREKCKELIVFHSKSDLKDLKKADLVITGAGKAGLIKPEMLKEGAGVIDFGYSFAAQINADQDADSRRKISGDFDSSNVNGQMPARQSLGDGGSNVSFYTPTPGGTGPILVAEIFKNFYKLQQK